jgi:uracil-DNA glycosylase family 4
VVNFKLVGLHMRIRNCTACSARADAAEPVPGIGKKTGIVFVGRNPGKNEDIQGRPFIGPSGIVLDQFLAACGLTRDDVYITNIALCHTYEDRELTKQELSTCVKSHFIPVISHLHPYLIVAMGREAAKTIANVTALAKSNGQLIKHKRGFWVIPMFHPASVLYNEASRVQLEYAAMQIKRFLAHRKSLLEEIGWQLER